jgi:hypothetical protein
MCQTDPHGSLLWLDFLAIKSNNIDWLDQVTAAMDVSYLPGFAYNRALGLRIKAQGKVCFRWSETVDFFTYLFHFRTMMQAIKLCRTRF